MKSRNFKQKKFLIFFSLGLFAALSVMVYAIGIRSPLNDTVVITVPRGASVSSVARQLEARGAIDSVSMFKMCVRASGGRVQSGEYEFAPRTSVWRIAHMLATGDVAATTVVIPEGLTIRQIKQLLLQVHGLTGPVECDKPGDIAVCNLKDGDIFPDTYRIARGTSRLALLDLARKKMDAIHDAWRRAGRIAPSPLSSWNDVITLASIVQKETPRAEEMPVVASVYINRLRQNMRLQADPTVVYALTDGLGDMRGEPLLRGHLKTESPYNTYMHKGLPPAPIANVGQAAIRAVLKPADTNYLFFVADGRGGHHFSKSYEQHMRHHADWREIKKSRN
ncbi:MAG: endolytic transglycosylase MltG [Alphaproteobacteria bacterium]|nr:endolytic transglycosylase MltG [Alphaproteobacteria bacterium]